MFADRLDLAEHYARLLATDGVVRGLIGPREAPRLWDRHLLNCAVLEEAIGLGASVCDLGSGAGLPGLVLAIVRPDLDVTLVEPLLRRTTFLEEAVEALGLERVTVVRARAEELHGGPRFDVVTSRAVAPLPRLLAWSLPLVASDGELVALKGSGAAAEVAEAAATIAEAGCAPARVEQLGADRVAEPTWAVRLSWADPSSVSSSGAGASRKARTAEGRQRHRRRGARRG